MNSLTTLAESPFFVQLLAGAIGVAVMLAAFLFLSIAGERAHPLRRRLNRLGTVDLQTSEVTEPGMGSTLRPFGTYLLPKHEKERETLKLKLIRAGFRSKTAAINLYIAKIVLAIVLPIAVLALLVSTTELDAAFLVLIASAVSMTGLFLPNYLLDVRIQKRHREMLYALPDALDLLVACTEAGLGLNAALQRVARQMDISSPLLARELEQVNAEMRGGMDRIAALRNLTHRTGLEEIRGLVSLLSQSVRFGSAIADILRIYAEEFRDKRSQAAEEQAALVGTKLIFPLCFCIFPSFFIVAVGPAVVALVKALA